MRGVLQRTGRAWRQANLAVHSGHARGIVRGTRYGLERRAKVVLCRASRETDRSHACRGGGCDEAYDERCERLAVAEIWFETRSNTGWSRLPIASNRPPRARRQRQVSDSSQRRPRHRPGVAAMAMTAARYVCTTVRPCRGRRISGLYLRASMSWESPWGMRIITI